MNRRAFLARSAALGAAVCAGALAGQGSRAYALGVDPLFYRSMPDLKGETHKLSQWVGKPLVANFWATWCAPCVREMPDLEMLHQKYGKIGFVGIGVDTASNMQAFIEKVKVGYPLLVAGHEGIQLMRDLGNKTGGLPFTAVFDARGVLNHRVLGQIKPQEFDNLLQAL